MRYPVTHERQTAQGFVRCDGVLFYFKERPYQYMHISAERIEIPGMIVKYGDPFPDIVCPDLQCGQRITGVEMAHALGFNNTLNDDGSVVVRV